MYAQPGISPGKLDTQTPLGFLDIKRSPDIGLTTGPYNNQQNRENLLNCGLRPD